MTDLSRHYLTDAKLVRVPTQRQGGFWCDRTVGHHGRCKRKAAGDSRTPKPGGSTRLAMARQRFGVRLSSAAFSPFENQPSAQLNRTLSRYPFALQVAAHKNVLVP